MVMDIVQLSGKLVESAITLSIIYVALINIFNQESKHQPCLAFGFGLNHGFVCRNPVGNAIG